MSSTTEDFLWSNGQSRSGLTTDAVVPESEELRDDYDVCIVGAGFAGLTAARELTAKGHKVLIVEARDRIGGRTWTAKEVGEAFEMGGTWVHWTQPHVYRELCRYDLERQLETSSGCAAAEQIFWKAAEGQLQPLDVLERTAIMKRLAKRCFSIDGMSSRELMPYPHDPLREPAPWKAYDHLSWRGRLDLFTDESQFSRDLLETEFNTMGATSGHEIGFVDALRWFALGGHTMEGTFEMAGTFKLGAGGMTSLATAMLHEAKADLAVQTVVTSLEQDSAGTAVTTEKGRKFCARCCICTIPLGSPFCFAFTDHDGTSTASAGKQTHCIGFGYNDRIPDVTDPEFVISAFRQNLKPDAAVGSYLTHDWANDPFAKGTWCCWAPGFMSKYLAALQQPHGRVFMASADSANGYRGFIDGAIERGGRAAEDVHRLLSTREKSLL